MGIGTTHRGVIRAMCMKMKGTSTVTEYEPGRRVDEAVVSGKTTVYGNLIFNAVDGGTVFTLVHDYRVGGLLKPFTRC